jgi:hypothetical protein
MGESRTIGCAKIYRHGRKFTPDELVERTTGAPVSTGPYLAYLREKYGSVHRLPPRDRLNAAPSRTTATDKVAES